GRRGAAEAFLEALQRAAALGFRGERIPHDALETLARGGIPGRDAVLAALALRQVGACEEQAALGELELALEPPIRIALRPGRREPALDALELRPRERLARP